MKGICEYCGEEFEKTVPNKRFCSELHRKRAENKRRYPTNKSAIDNLYEHRRYLAAFDFELYLEELDG